MKKVLKNFESVRVFFDNRVEWRNSAKQLHRIDGPAVIRNTGHWEWHIDGERHTIESYLKVTGQWK